MAFLQIIECQTSHPDAFLAMGKEFRLQSEASGLPRALRGWIAADQDRPGRYVTVLEYESAEAAHEATSSTETHEFFGYLRQVMDAPSTFYNLEVLDSWEIS